MTDMTLNTQQIQTTQTTQQNAPAQKAKTAEGESFSEKLDRAVTESKGGSAAEKQNEEEAQQIGAQMAAETLVDIPLTLIIPAVENAELTVDTAAAVENTVSQPIADSVITEQPILPETAPATDVPVLEQQAEQTADLQPEIPENLQKVEIIPADKITVEQAPAAEVPQEEAEQPISKLQAQSQFSKSVQQAQHLIRNTDSATSLRSQPLKIDIDELQKKVDAGEYLAQAQAAKQPVQTEQVQFKPEMAENLEPKEIFTQIRQGVEPHIAANESDFTIKLRPEGLGEITVKLASQDGRVTLSLSASDANVQRLLGSEMNTLRDIMRPYNVEVAQVEQSNSAVFADLQQQLQQQQSSQQNHPQQQGQFFAENYAEFPEAEEAAAPVQPEAVLDRYI